MILFVTFPLFCHFFLIISVSVNLLLLYISHKHQHCLFVLLLGFSCPALNESRHDKLLRSSYKVDLCL